MIIKILDKKRQKNIWGLWGLQYLGQNIRTIFGDVATLIFGSILFIFLSY